MATVFVTTLPVGVTSGDARAEAERAGAVLTMQRADTASKAYLDGLNAGRIEGLSLARAAVETQNIDIDPTEHGARVGLDVAEEAISDLIGEWTVPQ